MLWMMEKAGKKNSNVKKRQFWYRTADAAKQQAD
jgi:hypothetical protein